LLHEYRNDRGKRFLDALLNRKHQLVDAEELDGSLVHHGSLLNVDSQRIPGRNSSTE
jgi:hypothetical protein